MKLKLSFLLAFCIFLSCNNSDDASDPISGKVVNAFSGEPVENAEIVILENGPMTLTDANGLFEFTKDQVTNIPETDRITKDGVEGTAIFVSHDDFRPVERNVDFNKKTTVEVVPRSIPVFKYNRPVQLNDGLATGTLDDAGMNKQIIQNMMDNILDGDLKEIHSVLVYRNDVLVLEEYFFGNNDTIQFENNVIVDRTPPDIQWTRKGKHYIASVNKSLTSTVVGIALDKYGLTPDTKISQYLPQYSSYFSDPDKADISFADCLTMTAGLQWDEWGSNDLALMWKTDDIVDFLLKRNSLGVGAEWRYCSALPNTLLKAVDNMVDGSARDWAMDNLYGKLGITDLIWQSQPDGYPEGAARMYIRPRDMLKIGVTYLNDGVWNGTQVIPRAWVDACFDVKEATEFGDYSYFFWLRHLDGVDYLSADGDGGNYINIIPSLDMVIVVTQGNYLLWPFYVDQVDEMMQNYIFPSVN